MYHELYFVFKQSLFNLYYTIFNASVYKRDKRTFFLVRDNLPIPPIYPIHGEPSSIIYRTRVSRNSSRSGGADSWNNNKFSARIIFIGLADYLPRDGCWTRPDANKRSDFPRCRGLHSQIWLANKRGAHARAALDTRRTRCFASLIRSLAHLHLLIAIPSLRSSFPSNLEEIGGIAAMCLSGHVPPFFHRENDLSTRIFAFQWEKNRFFFEILSLLSDLESISINLILSRWKMKIHRVKRLGGQRSPFFFSLSSSRDHFSLGHVLNSRGRTKSHTFPPAGRHLVAGQNRHEYVMLVTYCFHRVFRQAGIVARRGGGGGKKGIFDLFEQTSFLPHSILLHSREIRGYYSSI